MTIPAYSFHGRDDNGFLAPRIVLRPPTSTRWLTVAMVTCWLGACALSLSLSLGWG